MPKLQWAWAIFLLLVVHSWCPINTVHAFVTWTQASSKCSTVAAMSARLHTPFGHHVGSAPQGLATLHSSSPPKGPRRDINSWVPWRDGLVRSLFTTLAWSSPGVLLLALLSQMRRERQLCEGRGASRLGASYWLALNLAGGVASFPAHEEEVLQVVASWDGETCASSSKDGAIFSWNPSTGQLRNRYEGHRRPVRGLALSPNGSLLLSGSDDTTLRLWHVESGSLVKTFRGSGSGVNTVAFSPDGMLAVSGTDDGIVHLWDIAAGLQADALLGHSDTVWTVSFAPSGKYFASGSEDQTVRLWAVAGSRGVVQSVIRGLHSPPTLLAYSPKGDLLAACLLDNTAIVWALKTGQELFRLQGVSTLAWTAIGQGLLTIGAEDSVAQLVNSTTGDVLCQLGKPADAITAISVSGNAKWLVTGDADGAITRLDISTFTPPQGAAEPAHRRIVSPSKADYPYLDPSDLADDAIRIIKRHVAAHNNLDIRESEIAKQMRDSRGNRSTESFRIAKGVLAAWRQKNEGDSSVVWEGGLGAAASLMSKEWLPRTASPQEGNPPPLAEIVLDVHCDIGCPWSYVGLVSLWTAIASFPECQFAIHLHPFIVDPDLPEEGILAQEHTQIQWSKPLQENSAAIGIGFKGWTYCPNTLHAHRLVQYAQQHGQGEAVLKALFQAVFEVGLNLDRVVLVEIGKHFGLPEVERFLWSDEGTQEVLESMAKARKQGIDEPPHYLVNREFPYVGTISVVQWSSILHELVSQEVAKRGAEGGTAAQMVVETKPP